MSTLEPASEWQGAERRRRSEHAAAVGAARFAGPRRARSSAAAWRCAAPAPCSSMASRSAPVRRRCPVVAGKNITTIEGLAPSTDEAASAAAGVDRSRRTAMWLLPGGPAHVRGGAAREERRSPPTPTSTRRWRATSAAAAPISAFAPPFTPPPASSPRGKPDERATESRSQPTNHCARSCATMELGTTRRPCAPSSSTAAAFSNSPAWPAAGSCSRSRRSRSRSSDAATRRQRLRAQCVPAHLGATARSSSTTRVRRSARASRPRSR